MVKMDVELKHASLLDSAARRRGGEGGEGIREVGVGLGLGVIA